MEKGKVDEIESNSHESLPQGILRNVPPKEIGEPQDIHEEVPSKKDGSRKGLVSVHRVTADSMQPCILVPMCLYIPTIAVFKYIQQVRAARLHAGGAVMTSLLATWRD